MFDRIDGKGDKVEDTSYLVEDLNWFIVCTYHNHLIQGIEKPQIYHKNHENIKNWKHVR